MATITLGKVKFMYRGTYNASTTYSKGDIVDHDNRQFIFKNDTPKAHAPVLLQKLNGSIPSLGVQTSVVRVTFTGFNPSSQTAGIVTAYRPPAVHGPEEWDPMEGLVFYNEWYSSGVGINSVNPVNSTQADLYLTNVGMNTSVISNSPVVLGPRRMCGFYEIAVNKQDWDEWSESWNCLGAWEEDRTYYPGDIVQQRNSSYICAIGHSAVDPLWDFPGVWEIFSRGDDLMPYDRCIGFVNSQPWNWHGHPYVDLPQWGTNNRYNGNIPWNTSLGIGSTSPHAWRWNPGWNKGHMSYRNTEHFIAGNGQIVSEGGTPTNDYHPGNGAHQYAREWSIGFPVDNLSGSNPDVGNLSPYRQKKQPRVIQAYESWNQMCAQLRTDGSITMSGSAGDGIWGYSSNSDGGSPNIGWAIPRKMFKNRSIVKIVSGGHQARDGDTHIIALDEYGEIHCWGRNDTGQCGISSEISHGNPDIAIFQNDNMSVDTRTWLVNSMNRHMFFEGKRIVDIWAGHRTSFAMDEDGNLWGWGYNNYGQLGYPTNNGFRSSDRSRTPKKLPVNWNAYGGIQKFITCGSEGNTDWLVCLTGDGYVWTCGKNNFGQLGQGNTSNNSNSSTLNRKTGWPGAGTISNIWADTDNGSSGHTYYRRSNGDTYGMGYNGHYNMTNGNTSNQTNPVAIYMPGTSSNQILKNLVAMAAGGRSGGTNQYFLTDKGHVYACGWNGYGAGGAGTSGTLTNNRIRFQQNGQRQYALGRKMHAPIYSAGGSNSLNNQSTNSANNGYATDYGGLHCIDVFGSGDYEGNVSHTTRSACLFDNGELTHSGRNYDWGFGNNRGHIYGSLNAHLIG